MAIAQGWYNKPHFHDAPHSWGHSTYPSAVVPQPVHFPMSRLLQRCCLIWWVIPVFLVFISLSNAVSKVADLKFGQRFGSFPVHQVDPDVHPFRTTAWWLSPRHIEEHICISCWFMLQFNTMTVQLRRSKESRRLYFNSVNIENTNHPGTVHSLHGSQCTGTQWSSMGAFAWDVVNYSDMTHRRVCSNHFRHLLV